MRRRDFIESSALAGGALLSPEGPRAIADDSTSGLQAPIPSMPLPKTIMLNLGPARWIWYPSERALQNTFVLFRRPLDLPEKPLRAKGWIAADGRYRLEVNGQRVQWGPAPSDPRWLEVDPVDLTELLRAGANALGAQVLYYGQGDGTWPTGKCGFIFRLEIDTAGGAKQTIVSDETWQAHLARPGNPAITSAGICVLFKRSSTRAFIPMAGRAPGLLPTRTGSPPCRLNARRTNLRLAPLIRNTCSISKVTPTCRNCGRGAFR